ncbi:MAG: DUF2142 domain-containing protein [Candidatus Ancillula sp.]|nr:DUF2142 domain-containing protein [Candidatus Ancillula sp.]
MKKKIISLLNYKNCLVGIFCLLAVSVGLFNIHYISGIAGPDPNRHFRIATGIASGNITVLFFKNHGNLDTNTPPTIIIPEEYEKLTSCAKNSGVEEELNYFDRDCIRNFKFDANNKNNVNTSVDIQMPMFSYIPQAIGMKIGMILNQSPVFSLNLARLFNLLFYILCFALSIRLIPRGKIFIALFGLIPGSLFIASSINGDSAMISLTTLFTCYIYYCFSKKQILDKRQVIILIMLGSFLFALKIAYIPLFILVLSLGKNVIKCKYKWILFIVVGSIGSALYLIWEKLVGYQSIDDNVMKIWHEQKIWIVTHPLHVLVSILRNMLIELGGFLKLGSGPFDWSIPLLLLAIILYSVTLKYKKIGSVKSFFSEYKMVLLSALALFGCMFLSIFAMLLTWTPYTDYMHIIGFQDRYLFELLPLLLVFMQIGKPKNKELAKELTDENC